jgi:hypothetical protein
MNTDARTDPKRRPSVLAHGIADILLGVESKHPISEGQSRFVMGVLSFLAIAVGVFKVRVELDPLGVLTAVTTTKDVGDGSLPIWVSYAPIILHPNI